MGNRVLVAMTHYAMATAESFRQAIETRAAVAVAAASLGQCLPHPAISRSQRRRKANKKRPREGR